MWKLKIHHEKLYFDYYYVNVCTFDYVYWALYKLYKYKLRLFLNSLAFFTNVF